MAIIHEHDSVLSVHLANFDRNNINCVQEPIVDSSINWMNYVGLERSRIYKVDLSNPPGNHLMILDLRFHYLFDRDSDLTSTNVRLSVCKQYVKIAEISYL